MNVSPGPPSRMVQDDVLGLGSQEPAQPVLQEPLRPSCGSIRHSISDPQSQGYTYQGKVEVAITKGPKQLLDLPTDVLHIIIYEVRRVLPISFTRLIQHKLTHTNDLTALALTNSALHKLVTPYIYARFDIVWPDGTGSTDSRAGVDALTFGLGTLVMREDLYNPAVLIGSEEEIAPTHEFTCNHCHKINVLQAAVQPRPDRPLQIPRLGNHYSQYVKKFSLGNGPTDWVKEYLITKEGGKMLGTLVAVALARMPNLESFVWDMPTGIIREIWQSLSKLRGKSDKKHPGLEKLSIRLHDNREVVDVNERPPKIPAALPGTVAGLPPPVLGSSSQAPVKVAPTQLEWSYKNIEHPGFSICPPLKSLTVLNIDEIAYLVELSILIGKSLNTLRELRLGMLHSGTSELWSSSRAYLDYKFTPETPEESYFYHGSTLGVLMSRIYDCRTQEIEPEVPPVHSVSKMEVDLSPGPLQVEQPEPEEATGTTKEVEAAVVAATAASYAHDCFGFSLESNDESEMPALDSDLSTSELSTEQTSPETISIDVPCIENSSKGVIWNRAETPAPELPPSIQTNAENPGPEKHPASPSKVGDKSRFPLSSDSPSPQETRQLLKLNTLAFEKLPITETVLVKSIDVTHLTSLTILRCVGHERLWRILRRKFAPQPPSLCINASETSATSPTAPSSRRTSMKISHSNPSVYQLSLKNLHTDAVSPSLISFIKETLEPNTLQSLFLQRRNAFYDSPVTTSSIHRGAVRTHRLSLTKLLVDSSEIRPTPRSTIDRSWKKWQVDRDILTYITTPSKFPKLREFGFCVSYKDWVYFLQRLPNLPQLRSLYVPHIDDDECRHRCDGKDLAAMVVDLVISLRPEIELAMMGLLNKCFEVLEGSADDKESDAVGNGEAVTGPGESPDEDPEDLDDEDGGEGSDDEGENQPPPNSGLFEGLGSTGEQEDSDLTDSDVSDCAESDPVRGKGKNKGKEAPAFRLREILFYDKIAIFKARHGRL